MSYYNCWQSGITLFTALSVIGGAAAPMILITPTFAQTAFSDVAANYWAKNFIIALAARDIMTGFPDGTFRPETPVTRAEFAAIIRKAFNRNPIRDAITFNDVPQDFWAASAIELAYKNGFLDSYQGRFFRPNQNISRLQILLALATGLDYTNTLPVNTILPYYNDETAIPSSAAEKVAAATEKGVVVNYPDLQSLQPNKTATRAEVAAFIYQALVKKGEVNPIASPYIVALEDAAPPQISVRIPAGTVLPVKYDVASKIILSPNEPGPIPLTLNLARNVASFNPSLLIPAGSQIVGELITVQDQKTAQFVAKEIVFSDGKRLPISASSKLVERTEEISQAQKLDQFIKNSAIGTAAAAALAAISGNPVITSRQVVLNSGFGSSAELIATFRNQEKVTLITIFPNRDLTLTLNSDLVLR